VTGKAIGKGTAHVNPELPRWLAHAGSSPRQHWSDRGAIAV